MELPIISLIVPTYNVSWYLRDFLQSLEKQTLDLSTIEIIFVDDGSSDGSAHMISDWISRAAPHAQLYSKPNGGLSSARNYGLERASGTWVTFCDPDDVISESYFEEVAEFVHKTTAQKVHLVATRLLFLNDSTGEISDTHPLRSRFKNGSQVIDLMRHPEYIHLSAATGFYRRAELQRRQLRFDERIKPNFEDAHLTGVYLAGYSHPRIAFLDKSKYFYRKRSNKSSLVQTSWNRKEKYTDLLRFGHLGLLKEIAEMRSTIPTWAQNLVLYDLMFYLREDENIHAATGSVSNGVASEFHTLVSEIMEFIDVETIYDYRLSRTSEQSRKALAIGVKGADLRPHELNVVRIDADKQIAQVRYFYSGNVPAEEFRARGYLIDPIHAKSRSINYLGKTLLHERIIWLPATGSLSIAIDGTRLPIVLGRPHRPTYSVGPTAMWKNLTSRPVPSDSPQKMQAKNNPLPSSGQVPASGEDTGNSRNSEKSPEPQVSAPSLPLHTQGSELAAKSSGADREEARSTIPLRKKMTLPVAKGRKLGSRLKKRVKSELQSRIQDSPAENESVASPNADKAEHGRHLKRDSAQILKHHAKSRSVQAKYGDAWVFIDRDNQAQDNAEHLYRYVHENHPEINSWFVLDQSSPDWDRLSTQGFRLVAHGTDEHTLLLLNCRHLISSQIDHYIVRPLDTKKYGWGSWRFTFLQHGVTKDDLSRWINGKPISLLVTASSDEFHSIAGNDTPYIFTTKETRLTGFPRHDRLLELADGTLKPDRDLLLVMPTWRRQLLGETVGDGNTRELRRDFEESQYAKEWMAVLRSERLKKIADSAGLTITFMPHPNMQDYLDRLDLPAHIAVHRYKDVDIQDILARGALMLTDYSSLAFEMAYIQRPVAYFQFDADEFFSGGHAYRKGTWDYVENGFGPVSTQVESLLDAAEDAVAIGCEVSEPYLSRMRGIFPHRDGRCSERVFQEIALLNEPITYEQAYLHVESPETTTDMFGADGLIADFDGSTPTG